MPFTFKLSRRLAGLPGAITAVTLVVVACELQRATRPTNVVDRVELLPVAVAVQPNQTVSFSVVAFNRLNDTADVTVTWSTTGGTITPLGRDGGRHMGQYRGNTCGQFQVVATVQPSGKADTANATVTCVSPPPPPPPPVAAVEVTPASATVDVTRTVQLTATPRDASGTPLSGRAITWVSGNTTTATVTASGLVSGVAEGVVTITATSEGRSGTSVITVVRVPVASVSVVPSSATVGVGSAVQLTATPRGASGTPLSGRTITWASGNTATATVTGSGLVRAIAEGLVTITATSEGQSGSAAITVVAAPPPGSGVVLVGAGDIASCSSSGDEATAALLDNIAGTVFTAGDNVYDSGTAQQFTDCYEPSWGRHKARTRPSPGNHDYNTSGATGYYNYFGANAGPTGRGYYSYDLGDWHVISLNSSVSMSAGSAQEQWLRADLAASTKRCTIAYWHHPRFSSGSHGSSTASQPLWQALYDHDADVIVVGHDHNYQRFAPQTPTGAADPARGIRQFVAGMGGRSHYNFGTPIANTEAYNTDAWGVLKLTLYADQYSWEFIPVAGKTYTDSGSGSCH